MRRAIVSGLVGLLLSCTPGVQGTAVTKYRAADSLRTVGDVVSQEQKDIVEVTDEGADILGAKHDSGYATDAAPDSDNSHDASSYTSDDSSLGQDAGCSDTGDAPECYTADIPRVDIWSPPRVDIGPVTIKEVGVPDYGITEGENTAEIYTTPEVDEGEVEGVLDEVSLNYEVDLPIQEDIILPEDTLSSMEESDVAKDTLDTLITPGECVPSEYQPVYGTEAWEIISTEGEQSFTYSVWGSDEKNVFFAGNGAAGRLLQYDGENLNMVVPYKEYSVLFAVWGTGSKVYAAGNDGGADNGLILELENGTITQQINQGIPAIFGIWGPPNSETVYFVGDTNKGGVLLQLQGDTLEQKEIGPVPDLTAIWGSSAEDFYIAGHDATLLHCNSQSCSKVEEILKFLPYQSMFPFFTVNGTDPQDIFVGGDSDKDGSGIILHFDGEQWTKMDVPTSLLASITGIWAKTPQEAYAIDTPSYVYYYNGCTWQTMANFKSLKVGNFWGLWGAENGELFVATGGGDILHYKPPK